MKAYVIHIPTSEVSVTSAHRLIETAKYDGNINVELWNGVHRDGSFRKMYNKGLRLRKSNQWESNSYLDCIVGCFMSHFSLWEESVRTNERIMVLEHDARFIKKLPSDRTFNNCKYDIIGINDPSMATRKSKLYHDKILEGTQFFQPVPTIDEFNVPQGLAGNSAYVIKPEGARKMLALAEEHGMWPNDALMCKQLINTIGVTKNFYTRVQGLRSTTTL